MAISFEGVSNTRKLLQDYKSGIGTGNTADPLREKTAEIIEKECDAIRINVEEKYLPKYYKTSQCQKILPKTVEGAIKINEAKQMLDHYKDAWSDLGAELKQLVSSIKNLEGEIPKKNVFLQKEYETSEEAKSYFKIKSAFGTDQSAASSTHALKVSALSTSALYQFKNTYSEAGALMPFVIANAANGSEKLEAGTLEIEVRNNRKILSLQKPSVSTVAVKTTADADHLGEDLIWINNFSVAVTAGDSLEKIAKKINTASQAKSSSVIASVELDTSSGEYQLELTSGTYIGQQHAITIHAPTALGAHSFASVNHMLEIPLDINDSITTVVEKINKNSSQTQVRAVMQKSNHQMNFYLQSLVTGAANGFDIKNNGKDLTDAGGLGLNFLKDIKNGTDSEIEWDGYTINSHDNNYQIQTTNGDQINLTVYSPSVNAFNINVEADSALITSSIESIVLQYVKTLHATAKGIELEKYYSQKFLAEEAQDMSELSFKDFFSQLMSFNNFVRQSKNSAIQTLEDIGIELLTYQVGFGQNHIKFTNEKIANARSFQDLVDLGLLQIDQDLFKEQIMLNTDKVQQLCHLTISGADSKLFAIHHTEKLNFLKDGNGASFQVTIDGSKKKVQNSYSPVFTDPTANAVSTDGASTMFKEGKLQIDNTIVELHAGDSFETIRDKINEGNKIKASIVPDGSEYRLKLDHSYNQWKIYDYHNVLQDKFLITANDMKQSKKFANTSIQPLFQDFILEINEIKVELKQSDTLENIKDKINSTLPQVTASIITDGSEVRLQVEANEITANNDLRIWDSMHFFDFETPESSKFRIKLEDTSNVASFIFDEKAGNSTFKVYKKAYTDSNVRTIYGIDWFDDDPMYKYKFSIRDFTLHYSGPKTKTTFITVTKGLFEHLYNTVKIYAESASGQSTIPVKKIELFKELANKIDRHSKKIDLDLNRARKDLYDTLIKYAKSQYQSEAIRKRVEIMTGSYDKKDLL